MRSIQTTEIFDAWFAGLKDRQARVRIQVRIDHGPGYRVYFIQRGLEMVILLAGGDKSSQVKDIKTALQLAREL